MITAMILSWVCFSKDKHFKIESVEYEAKSPRAPPALDDFESENIEYFDQAKAW